MYDQTITDHKARIQAYIRTYIDEVEGHGLFDSLLMQNLKTLSAGRGSASKDASEAYANFEIDVRPEFCNRMGNMHGGCVSLLADMTTSMVVIPVTEKGFWDFGGVSRTLDVTFLQPIPKGSTIVVECMLRSIGKRLATAQCIIRSKETGKPLALAEHGKVALRKPAYERRTPIERKTDSHL